MANTVVVIGTLDTKEAEFGYLKELIENKGLKTILIDCSILGEVSLQPDYTAAMVARAGKSNLENLRTERQEGKAMATMISGATEIVRELYLTGKLDGIISLGGTMGTSLGLAVMRTLPSMPKLMVSTMTFTRYISPAVGKDITLMPSIADIWGLNRITKQVVQDAANAIVGMVKNYRKIESEDKPVIGITTLGSAVNSFAPLIKPALDDMGYEAIVFHSTGPGGRALEDQIRQGTIQGVLDLSLHELICHYCDGDCDPGEDRLQAASETGIPQVVSCASLDFFGWPGSPDTLPPHRRERKMHMHNPLVWIVRTSAEELATIGEMAAARLNKANGPVIMLVPMKGFSALDTPGSLFYDPDADKAFVKAFESTANSNIKIIKLDLHVNDPQFSAEAINHIDFLMKINRG